MNDKPIAHSRGGASVEYASAATRLILLFGVCAVLIGALLVAPGLMPARQAAPVADTPKVGPTFSAKQPMSPAAQPTRAAAVPAPSSAPTTPPPSLSSVSSNPAVGTVPAAPPSAAPVAAPQPKTAPAEPASVASLADEEEVTAAADAKGYAKAAKPVQEEKVKPKRPERIASSSRQPRCTTYRTYNPSTQTYRSYDGVTRPCRAE